MRAGFVKEKFSNFSESRSTSSETPLCLRRHTDGLPHADSGLFAGAAEEGELGEQVELKHEFRRGFGVQMEDHTAGKTDQFDVFGLDCCGSQVFQIRHTDMIFDLLLKIFDETYMVELFKAFFIALKNQARQRQREVNVPLTKAGGRQKMQLDSALRMQGTVDEFGVAPVTAPAAVRLGSAEHVGHDKFGFAEDAGRVGMFTKELHKNREQCLVQQGQAQITRRTALKHLISRQPEALKLTSLSVHP